MSDSMASLMGNGVTQQPGQTSQLSAVQGTATEDTGGTEFPSLFHKVITEAAGVAENDAMSAPVEMAATSMLPLQPFSVNGVTSPDVNFALSDGLNPDAQVLPLVGMQEGNALPILSPQMAWSGYVAYANNNGAAAQSFLGAGEQGIQTTPVLDANLHGSIQRSQQQLQDFLGLPPANLTVSSAPVLNKQAGELMERLLVAGQDRPVTESALLQQSNHTAPLTTMVSTSATNDLFGTALSTARAGDAIHVAPQHTQWGQQVGDRVHWMIGQGLQQADIRLNPPELGSLEIRIQLQGDQATVNFTSPHGVVRDALDAAMPRLREMLEQSGLNLADVNVSSQSPGQQGEQANQSASGGHDDAQTISVPGQEDVTNNTQTAIQDGLGMLDVYA